MLDTASAEPTNLISTSAALERARSRGFRVSPQTINRWLNVYEGLGQRVVGRWYVRADVFDRLLAGEEPKAKATAA